MTGTTLSIDELIARIPGQRRDPRAVDALLPDVWAANALQKAISYRNQFGM